MSFAGGFGGRGGGRVVLLLVVDVAAVVVVVAVEEEEALAEEEVELKLTDLISTCKVGQAAAAVEVVEVIGVAETEVNRAMSMLSTWQSPLNYEWKNRN